MAFSTAHLQLLSLAILRAFNPPSTKFFVTSSPVLKKTLSPLISEGVLGILNPPNTSGQTSTTSILLESKNSHNNEL